MSTVNAIAKYATDYAVLAELAGLAREVLAAHNALAAVECRRNLNASEQQEVDLANLAIAAAVRGVTSGLLCSMCRLRESCAQANTTAARLSANRESTEP